VRGEPVAARPRRRTRRAQGTQGAPADATAAAPARDTAAAADAEVEATEAASEADGAPEARQAPVVPEEGEAEEVDDRADVAADDEEADAEDEGEDDRAAGTGCARTAPRWTRTENIGPLGSGLNFPTMGQPFPGG